MLFSICKTEIRLELVWELQNHHCFSSGMHYRASGPKFRAENRARIGPQVYFGYKMEVFKLFTVCTKQIWLELAWGLRNHHCFTSGMH